MSQWDLDAVVQGRRGSIDFLSIHHYLANIVRTAAIMWPLDGINQAKESTAKAVKDDVQ